MLKVIIFTTLFFWIELVMGQPNKSIHFQEDTTLQLFDLLDQLVASDLPLIYSESRIPNQQVQLKAGLYSIKALISLINIDGLELTEKNESYVLTYTSARKNYVYSGYVRDQSSGEVLIGAIVFVDSTSFSITNSYGYFSIQTDQEIDSLSAQYLGYQTTQHSAKKGSQSILLWPIKTALKDVTIRAYSVAELQHQALPGSHQLDYDEKGDIPYFMGEIDVLQETLMLPGIKTLGEDASSIHIRGGNNDQNLILLDEAIVFNPNHFFGLISIFNPEAVNQVQLLKGYIPAEYGGRGSSIISVKQREGNYQKFSGAGGIGFVSGRLLLEGPLARDKASFLVSARQSIFDLSTNRFDRNAIRRSRTAFQDLNLKANWRVNKNNTVYLSTYLGNDRTKSILEQTNRWGNNTATLRWNHLWNDNVFSNFSAIFSDYNYRVVDPLEVASYIGRSEIQNINIKYNTEWSISERSEIKFGTQLLWHKLSPGERLPFDTLSSTIPIVLDAENGLEHGSYISHSWQIHEKLSLQYGVRFTGLSTFGPGPVFSFEENKERLVDNISDTTYYGRNEIIDRFLRAEPRVLITWRPDGHRTIKAAYTRSQQYLQLISSSIIPAPTDTWKLSNRLIDPLQVDQYSLGYYQGSANQQWQWSTEAYIKFSRNLIEYKNGANLILNPIQETELLIADGRSYGLELMARKLTPPWTGWVSYTLSRSERRVRSDFAELQINDGAYYPDNHDKLHDFTAVIKYQPNQKWSFSSALYYNSGRPITFPSGKYEINGQLVTDYSERNQNRISDYHRMDLSCKWEPAGSTEKKWHHAWAFNIYNVYARKNAYTYLFRSSKTNPRSTEVVSYSLFGTAIPSITYNFSF